MAGQVRLRLAFRLRRAYGGQDGGQAIRLHQGYGGTSTGTSRGVQRKPDFSLQVTV